MTRRRGFLPALLLTVAACSPATDTSGIPDLPEAETAALVESIVGAGVPAVLNVWASWCAPCRSEAPLLAAAADEFADEVDFVGINVQDSQNGAKSFIADFLGDAPIVHFIDRDGSTVADLGGSSGVPLTLFVNADGTVAKIHFGVIDERTLALEVDELVKAHG